ncbi:MULTISPECIES: hypothetical protein [unclassified Pantoea]|uniref:hypothetical protein n=1 Tax=unclassified Pantoea TaxID=2630326 RepID=UPI00123261CE|nr:MULTISPECIES: hypothetical protein [unclassified Pantoea]KAA5971989.1 hypothetical protein F3I51_09940 [Pantoea sp. M_6]KAA5977259.1 hypothetical protein F3I52_09195 [Pantoea sp. M_8]KAA5993453.1 hypothetical protein F3I47_00080 [Pantoea sp. M_10]
MDKIYVFFYMVLGIWSICSICLKKQIFAKKFFKSIFSALYFLTACGLAIEPSNSALASFFMLVLGATVVWFCNRKYEEKENVNKDVISDYKNAERNFGLGEGYEVKYKSSSNNYAKDKDLALKEIAFA